MKAPASQDLREASVCCFFHATPIRWAEIPNDKGQCVTGDTSIMMNPKLNVFFDYGTLFLLLNTVKVAPLVVCHPLATPESVNRSCDEHNAEWSNLNPKEDDSV